MKTIDTVLKRHHLKTLSYEKKGNVVIIDSNRGKLVLKKDNNSEMYKYLNSRDFTYYPKHLYDNEYEIMEYVEDIKMPNEQRMLDLINLVSLLHNKTTYFKNVDIDEYKKNYEDLIGNINYLNNYYNDLITIIESRIYMSPSELLLARNISIIFNALSYAKNKLDEWYELVKKKNKRRYTVVHNDLRLEHFIKNENSYLISFNKAYIDIPIYDFYKLYKKYALDYDFDNLMKVYENNYKLLEEEKTLLFILITIPDKIDFNDNEYNLCVKITKLIDYLYKTEKIVLPNNFEDTKQNKER